MPEQEQPPVVTRVLGHLAWQDRLEALELDLVCGCGHDRRHHPVEVHPYHRDEILGYPCQECDCPEFDPEEASP